MVMYDPPYCVVCGGPFDPVELLDFGELGEDDQYLKDCAYDAQLLSPAQSAYDGKSTALEADIYVSADVQWQQDEDWLNAAPIWANTASKDESSNISTRYQEYFTVHDDCMEILQTFVQYQSIICSTRLPKTLREFIEACNVRQDESIHLQLDFDTSGQRGNWPPAWTSLQKVEHSHLYFGARRFWTDPWDCEPGFEYLCADPIHELGVEAFISTVLAYHQPSRKCLSSLSSQQLEPPSKTLSSDDTFIRLPREIIDIVVSHLSLQDALSLCSSSRKLLDLSDSNFWRTQTIQLHGCWFWELRDHPMSSLKDNWKKLLQILTINRSRIREEAEPYWLTTFASKNDGTEGGSIDGAEVTVLPLPLGLRNRQRIWMCLETVGTKAEWEMKAVRQKQPRSQLSGGPGLDLDDTSSQMLENMYLH